MEIIIIIMERGEIFPSLTVDVNSPTPYTDATQVTKCNLEGYLHKSPGTITLDF